MQTEVQVPDWELLHFRRADGRKLSGSYTVGDFTWVLIAQYAVVLDPAAINSTKVYAKQSFAFYNYIHHHLLDISKSQVHTIEI